MKGWRLAALRRRSDHLARARRRRFLWGLSPARTGGLGIRGAVVRSAVRALRTSPSSGMPAGRFSDPADCPNADRAAPVSGRCRDLVLVAHSRRSARVHAASSHPIERVTWDRIVHIRKTPRDRGAFSWERSQRQRVRNFKMNGDRRADADAACDVDTAVVEEGDALRSPPSPVPRGAFASAAIDAIEALEDAVLIRGGDALAVVADGDRQLGAVLSVTVDQLISTKPLGRLYLMPLSTKLSSSCLMRSRSAHDQRFGRMAQFDVASSSSPRAAGRLRLPTRVRRGRTVDRDRRRRFARGLRGPRDLETRRSRRALSMSISCRNRCAWSCSRTLPLRRYRSCRGWRSAACAIRA